LADRLPSLDDLLRPGLTLVFIGFNPSLVSWERGHYYANPVNRFYALLHASGMTPRLLSPGEDRSLPDYGIGAVDLLPGKPSARAGHYSASEYRSGIDALQAKIESNAPKSVCCNGYGVFRYVFSQSPARAGLQDGLTFGPSLVFVTPSTSGLANGKSAERLQAFHEMSAWMKSL
jgi:TDG/mug DNA glycosylase family protein